MHSAGQTSIQQKTTQLFFKLLCFQTDSVIRINVPIPSPGNFAEPSPNRSYMSSIERSSVVDSKLISLRSSGKSKRQNFERVQFSLISDTDTSTFTFGFPRLILLILFHLASYFYFFFWHLLDLFSVGKVFWGKTLFKQYVLSLFLKLSTEELDLMQKGSKLKNIKSETRRRVLQMIWAMWAIDRRLEFAKIHVVIRPTWETVVRNNWELP